MIAESLTIAALLVCLVFAWTWALEAVRPSLDRERDPQDH